MAVDTPNKGEVQDREKREDEILKAEAEQLKKYTQSQGSIRWNLLRMLVIILTGKSQKTLITRSVIKAANRVLLDVIILLAN